MESEHESSESPFTLNLNVTFHALVLIPLPMDFFFLNHIFKHPNLLFPLSPCLNIPLFFKHSSNDMFSRHQYPNCPTLDLWQSLTRYIELDTKIQHRFFPLNTWHYEGSYGNSR